MRRREFITLFGSAALVQPFAARAQQAAPTIGFLDEGLPEPLPLMVAFRRGLLKAGIGEAGSVAFENRWAQGQYDRLPVLAIELSDAVSLVHRCLVRADREHGVLAAAKGI